MQAQKSTKSSPVLAFFVKSLIFGFSTLPLRLSQWIGGGIGMLLWLTPNRLREVSRRNVKRCFPELSDEERSTLIRESLSATGQNTAEAGAMWKWSSNRLEKLEAGVENEELLHLGMERGRGVLLLAPHVGNWEYFTYFLIQRYPILSLYRPPRIAELDTLIRQARQRLGTEMVPATGSGLRTFAKALGAGRLVAILPDQEPLKRHGVFAPFFGSRALTMTLVRSLVRRYDPAVVFAFAERTRDGKFYVRFLPPPEGLGDSDTIRAATQLNLGVEACVLRCPGQYMWSYRRFRTRPPDESSSGAPKS
jgi:KDO2-lipid IV(A) lauroyltransferase